PSLTQFRTNSSFNILTFIDILQQCPCIKRIGWDPPRGQSSFPPPLALALEQSSLEFSGLESNVKNLSFNNRPLFENFYLPACQLVKDNLSLSYMPFFSPSAFALIGQFRNLKKLSLSDVEDPEEYPDLSNLQSLRQLSIESTEISYEYVGIVID